MVLNTEKRARLAEVLSTRDDATAKAGTSAHPAFPASQTASLPPSTQTTPTPASPQATPTPTSPQATPAPTSPAPIATVPLATIRASPPLGPLEKNKWVVLITSDDDEDTMEGPAFKRRKTTMVATSHSSSVRCPASLRGDPPSASSPPNLLALEGGAESVPEPAPSPELPLVHQQVLTVESLENRETKGALATVCTPTIKSVSRAMNTKLSLLDHCVFSLTLFTLRNA